MISNYVKKTLVNIKASVILKYPCSLCYEKPRRQCITTHVTYGVHIKCNGTSDDNMQFSHLHYKLRLI